ncbi:MAG: prenyltransferase [Candidatus Thiodiazotropha sp.]|nr:prenyltransferase [Candidatus Thiodiazotropha sp.]MCU7805463.1 prenyltransferase [Candidatus Thiodiazotropha sp. (ex Lucinoma borealis)]MCU7841759.1 prenyltransferase [Candidatus Thiodiazotropha sp. (ex Troendleina suluensis)]MCM8885030.1 prenyltransferase [Candidatus Thiodiazotropha sp.]MCM8921033.1 prenyltransferase [Candidatus Thiodiazotropha sp.]
MSSKYTFLGAMRPFSLVVAIATCGLGISLALIDHGEDGWLAWLVLTAGLLLQIAVNLINDYPDLENATLDLATQRSIRRNAKIGWAVMLLAVAIGLYMVSIRGYPLLLLGLVGVAGAWGYTGGKVNYKQRGLGIILVFLLMGVLLIGGSYYVLTGRYTMEVFWLSLPFSLLSSLLLLSNELRDFESDRDAGIRTLIVRIGYDSGVRLYYLLVSLVYLICALLFWSGMLPGLLMLLVTSVALIGPISQLKSSPAQRIKLTSLTGRFYLLFGATYLATLWSGLP